MRAGGVRKEYRPDSTTVRRGRARNFGLGGLVDRPCPRLNPGSVLRSFSVMLGIGTYVGDHM